MRKLRKNLHPLIEELVIPQKVKNYFNKLELYDIIEDPIVFSSDSEDIDECRANCWSFKLELKYCSPGDIKVFYQAVMKARKQYLLNNNINIQMIFYTWYEDISGNFYFSLIPTNWPKLRPGKELPFGCTIKKVDSLDIIIEEFINDPYKGKIPLNELKDVDPNEEDEEEDLSNYTLNVWSIIL